MYFRTTHEKSSLEKWLLLYREKCQFENLWFMFTSADPEMFEKRGGGGGGWMRGWAHKREVNVQVKFLGNIECLYNHVFNIKMKHLCK